MLHSIWLLILLLVSCCAAFDPSNYHDSAEVFPRYTVYWRVDQNLKMLNLAIHVQTTGWVGFGIAEFNSGSMPGADIVIGYVEDGIGKIGDYWSSDYVLPNLDDCQDWNLLSVEQSDGFTTVEVSRKLDTNDTQDRVITFGPNRIIAAFGESNSISYHSINRMTSEITFFGNITVPDLPSNIQTMDLVMDDFFVPDGETQYGCMSFILPSDKKYHIVRIDPVVQPENVMHVHHFLANICVFSGAVTKYLKPLSCSPAEIGVDGCSGLLAGGAAGGGPAYFPPDAGMPMGVDGTQYVLLQIHYNNPTGVGGYYDNSGFRIFYTSELRKYDAGVLTLGDPFVAWRNSKLIPPLSITEFEAECPSVCTSQFPHEIYLFQSAPHMHEKGFEFWTTQWRDGVKINEFGRIEFWSFNHQNLNVENITIKPGDRLNTHCVYDTREVTTTTQFGFSSDTEMCMHFVGYYPRITTPIQLSYCGYAAPNYTVCGGTNRTLLMPYTNPSFFDPPGGINRTFGRNESVCPEPQTTASITTTSTTSSSANNISKMGCYYGLLLSFLIFLLC